MGTRIIATGSYLPETVVSNVDLEQICNTSDEWIKSRSGIVQRHIASKDQTTCDMACRAAEKAIASAKIDPKKIDLVIVCTNTPDQSFPSVASRLQNLLQLSNIPAFDMQAICSGFIYGMNVADSMIKSGSYNTILLVCSDKMSSLVDWNNRNSCVLFGDGAGAVILTKDDDPNIGVIDSHIFSDGSCADILYTEIQDNQDDNGNFVSISQDVKIIEEIQKKYNSSVQMKGPELFKKAVEKMSKSVKDILAKNSILPTDVAYFIPHQANLRIINNITEKCNLDPSKVVTTVTKHANCSAASIPLALDDLNKQNQLHSNDLLVFTAFGAGLTWGSLILRW